MKWSEKFSLKIHLKVKKSESENLVSLSEVKWSENISPNFHLRVKKSESENPMSLSEVKWSERSSPSLHLHLSEKILSEFASLGQALFKNWFLDLCASLALARLFQKYILQKTILKQKHSQSQMVQ